MSKLTGIKRKNFTQEENKALVELVTRHRKILLNKTSNAVTWANKEGEWQKIEGEYNQKGLQFRDKESLKLKWELLKKQARKRHACIKRNARQTGGGAGDYIPEDAVLDATIGLLGISCTGLKNPYDDEEESPLIGVDAAKVHLPKDEFWPRAFNLVADAQIEYLGDAIAEEVTVQVAESSPLVGQRCHLNPIPTPNTAGQSGLSGRHNWSGSGALASYQPFKKNLAPTLFQPVTCAAVSPPPSTPTKQTDPVQGAEISSPSTMRCNPLPATPTRASGKTKIIPQSLSRVKTKKPKSVKDQLALAKIRYLEAETQLAKKKCIMVQQKSNLIRLQCVELRRRLSNKN